MVCVLSLVMWCHVIGYSVLAGPAGGAGMGRTCLTCPLPPLATRYIQFWHRCTLILRRRPWVPFPCWKHLLMLSHLGNLLRHFYMWAFKHGLSTSNLDTHPQNLYQNTNAMVCFKKMKALVGKLTVILWKSMYSDAKIWKHYWPPITPERPVCARTPPRPDVLRPAPPRPRHLRTGSLGLWYNQDAWVCVHVSGLPNSQTDLASSFARDEERGTKVKFDPKNALMRCSVKHIWLQKYFFCI